VKRVRVLRAALLIANVLLVVGLLALAREIFFTHHETTLPRLDVKGLVLVEKPLPGAEAYTTIWKELDHPPEPEEPKAPAPPPRPSLTATLALAIVAIDAAHPEQRGCILNPLGPGEQLVLKPGQSSAGYTCETIEKDELGWYTDVTSSSGASGRIRLKHEDEPAR